MGSTIRNVTMTPPPWPAPPAAVQPRRRLTAVLAVLVVMLAITAVTVAVVALTRTAPAPTYSAAQRAEAQANLCSRYRLAANAARVDTTSSDVALARISTTNGALMLETAAANPALEANFREAALALAVAYQTMTAKGTQGVADDAQRQAALDDAIAKDHALKDLCGD